MMYMVTTRGLLFYVMPQDGKWAMGPYLSRDEATRVCAMLNGAPFN